MMGGGAANPFNEIMQQAVKLKGAQQAKERPKFDNFPKFYQNSMFSTDELTAARLLPMSERIAKGRAMKEEGNKLFREGKYFDCTMKYERALAIFKYIQNTDEGWKKKGIKDEDLQEVDILGDTSEERSAIKALKQSLYLNLASAAHKEKDYPTAIKACGCVLELDPSNVKALYRRAQALITPASAGATEEDMAIKDLARAAEIDPTHAAVRRDLRTLRESRRAQRVKDKAQYSGMFNRGTVYEGVDRQLAEEKKMAASGQRSEGREPSAQQQIEDAERLVRLYRQQGKVKEADELEVKVKEAREYIEKKKEEARSAPPPRMDFRNPTPEMIEDAKKQGIDLSDPAVLEMLTKLQEEKEGEERGDTVRGIDKTARAAIDEEVEGMNMKQLMAALDEAGVNHDHCESKDELKELVRELRKQFVTESHLKDLEAKKEERARLTWNVAFGVAAVAVCYRFYQMGMLGWMWQLVTSGEGSTIHSAGFSEAQELEQEEEEWEDWE